MSLPWVRLDSNIASHPKVLALLGMRDGARAFTLYACALGYAGGHATDGHIPRYALPVIHGTERLARMLVDVGLWHHAEGGWSIHNWEQRQELAVISESKRASQRLAAQRTNCLRYHGPDCGCWRERDASVLPMRKTDRSSDR